MKNLALVRMHRIPASELVVISHSNMLSYVSTENSSYAPSLFWRIKRINLITYFIPEIR